MLKFPEFALPLMLIGCVGFGTPKTSSKWAILSKTKELNCDAWPIREKDLRIDEIKYFRGEEPGFIVSGMKRNGNSMSYWAPFKRGVKLNSKTFINIPTDGDIVVAGGGSINKDPSVGLIVNRMRSSAFEIRAIKTGKIKFQSDIRQSNIKDAWLVENLPNSWLITHKDDNDAHVFLLRTNPDISLSFVPGAVFKEPPIVLATYGLERAISLRFKQNKIIGRTLTMDRHPQEDFELDLSIKEEIESWTATGYRDDYFVSYVDGDSIVGRAELRLSRLRIDGGGAVTSDFPPATLKDVHVGQPVFVTTSTGLSLLLMQWMDDESTIARFDISHSGLEAPVYTGIFPKGGRIVATIADEKDEDVFVVVRHKNNDEWSYQICEL